MLSVRDFTENNKNKYLIHAILGSLIGYRNSKAIKFIQNPLESAFISLNKIFRALKY